MKSIFSWTLLIMIFLFGSVLGQDGEQTPPPCSDEGFHQFDFWIGEWDLSWGDGENAGTGTNIITKTLGSCVIEENFSSDDDKPFLGRSLSAYQPAEKKWYQTWVDNNGGYLDFVGDFKDGKMILSREAEHNGEKFLQRMVFHDISEESFVWDWEKSTDNGESWELLWQINYKRKK